MAREKGSKKSKPKSAIIATATTASSKVFNAPPEPFKPVSSNLYPLTECMPEDHVIVVHPEKTPAALRKQTFVVPVLLNSVLLIVLCHRIFYAVPIYLEQIITIMGFETAYTVHPKELPWADLLSVLGSRTMLLSFDYVLFGLLGRWPLEFLMGNKHGRYVGCAAWKWNIGFERKTEIIVRRGRKWDTSLFESDVHRLKQGLPGKSWSKEEELSVYNKATTALDRLTTSKSALSLLDKNWDLDYKAMVDATDFFDERKLSIDDIDHVVLVCWGGRWYFWYPHKSTASNELDKNVQQQDVKLEKFKKVLTDHKCDDVFYRWIEIVQYETAQPGGFTVLKKKEAEQELRKLLTRRKQDSDQIFNAVGGVHEIPGLAQHD